MHYRVEVGLGLTGALEALLADSVADARALFPNQARAIQGLAQLTQRRWLEYASGARPLGTGQLHSATGAYLSSIKIEEEGALRYVIYSDDPKAAFIEEGFPSFDLKKMLATSHKARTTKDGRKYLVVPFRHKMPSAGALGVVMPQEAQQWWLAQDRRSSVVTGHYRERSVQDGVTPVTRNTYQWGDRMTRADVQGMGLEPDSALGSRLVGMVRFQHNEDRGGSYVTFRVMVEGGKGWLVPARAGQWPARAAFEWAQGQYEALMRVALEEDVRRLGGTVS